MRLLILIIISLVVAQINTALSNELVIRHIAPETENDLRRDYYLTMLRLVLDKTKESHGTYRLVEHHVPMYQGRAVYSLKKNQFLDIVWTMTSIERESELLPVRIPLLKGLVSHRIFIIREGDQHKFMNVNSIHDLKGLVAGQGHDWPDATIMHVNGLNVMPIVDYERIFLLLSLGKIDYFPRGLNEPFVELLPRKNLRLTVEKNLILQYPAPMYFFVNKQNVLLAKRLETGMLKAIEDGSFDNVFFNHPHTKEIFEKTNLENRKIIRLINPLLPPETPLSDKRLWYTPEKALSH